MYKYSVTDSGFRLTLGYLGYYEVLQLSHDLEKVFKQRVKLRRDCIRLEEELQKLRSRQLKTEPKWRRGHSVLSFYNDMSGPSSRPRTRQSEPVRPTSRQTLVRERTAISTRPSSRQTSQRTSSFPQKKENTTSRKDSTSTSTTSSVINLDEAYQRNNGPEAETKPLWYPEPDIQSTGSGKIQAPVLPHMRLQRETTSFGVYSHLSSHNRNGNLDTFTEETFPVAEGVQLQILDAIRKQNTTQLRFILDSNPNLKLSFTDQDGIPVLHLAVLTSNRAIVELLLSRNVVLETCDGDGRNVLHLAASKGFLQIVDLLLKKNVGINTYNKVNRRTALHEAILGCHGDTIEYLLLRGINSDIKDKTGQTAASYCSQNYPRKEFDRVLSAVASTRIDIEMLQESSITTFTNTCLVTDTTHSRLPHEVVMMCKRQGAEQCGLKFNIQDTDDVISDVFTYRIDHSLKAPIPVVISLPVLYAPRSSKEELKIKTNEGYTISPSDIIKENQGWQCRCKTNLGQSGAFVVVCRPTMEEFDVAKENKVMTLASDPRVQVTTLKGGFNKPSIITLQVLEPSDDTEIEENQVLSSTPFYRIHSTILPSKPLNIQLPVPDDYGQDKDSKTVILTRSDGSRNWDVLENTETKSNTEVSFNTKHLPLHAVVVKAVPVYKKEALAAEINDIFQQMTKREFTINFLCMTKRSLKTNKFHMVLECCEVTLTETRRRVWSSKGYIEQKQKEPLDRFSVDPKQAFNVVFYDNIVTKKNKRMDVLRYHPKRDSVVMFELPDDVPLVSARLFIYKTDNVVMNGNTVNVDDIVENRKDLVKSIDVMKIDIAREKTVVRPDLISDSSNKVSSKDIAFLTDSLLDELIVEMDKEWYKICILMGMTFRQVENSLVIEGKLKHKITELIQGWRNEKQSREDVGLPLLMAALFKGGRRDIANTVQIELKKWYSSMQDKAHPFYKWVTRAYKDSDLLVPSEYPKPMSDEYLVLMAEDLSPTEQLARGLTLTDSETDEILHSNTYLQDGIRVMKMLTLFRDSISNRIDALQKLVTCLDELGCGKIKNYSIMCAKAWLKRTASRKDDPLRYQVDAFVKKLS